MKIKVIITGSTGMVGKSVLLECLKSDHVASVLIINRRALSIKHPKLKEIIHTNLSDLNPIVEHLEGYDACFHCMGVSVVGLNEDTYTKLTFGITKHFADVLYDLNPNMVFNYVSGTGTDSSEEGKAMWARVKGKTENMVLSKGFKDAYAIRLGVLIPGKGIKSTTGWINFMLIIFKRIYPILKRLKSVTTSEKLGRAMINTLFYPQELKHLENPQLNELAERRKDN